MSENRSVGDIEGAWRDQGFESGLIARCRQDWLTPIGELTNQALATFIRQELALAVVLAEAERRIKAGFTDDSELYDGELVEAIRSAR